MTKKLLIDLLAITVTLTGVDLTSTAGLRAQCVDEMIIPDSVMALPVDTVRVPVYGQVCGYPPGPGAANLDAVTFRVDYDSTYLSALGVDFYVHGTDNLGNNYTTLCDVIPIPISFSIWCSDEGYCEVGVLGSMTGTPDWPPDTYRFWDLLFKVSDNLPGDHCCPLQMTISGHTSNYFTYGVTNVYPVLNDGSICTPPPVPPHVLSTSPSQNELNVPVDADILVTFDGRMNDTSINDSTFIVYARSKGPQQGVIAYHSQTKTATFSPTNEFGAGEVVTAVLTTGVESSDGVSLDSSYTWCFTVMVGGGMASFISDSVYAVGLSPFSVFAADLDGDGDLDLAAANYGTDDVSILKNCGDGTFAADSVYPVGDGPLSVCAADFDGDRDLDLAVANHGTNDVSILENWGEGTFAPDSVYPVGDGPYSVSSADLDGNGSIDLAVADRNSDDVSILLNTGNGSFAASSFYPVGDHPLSVVVADLDGDGCQDLATADRFSGTVSILLSCCDGSFVPDSAYPVGSSPSSVCAADLDGDGDLDLTTANVWSDDVSVLLNNGDGSFASHSVYPAGDGPMSVCVADLDGDGDLDLTTANVWSDNAAVFPNNGDGTFAPNSLYPVGDAPLSILAVDVDGDKDLDLAVANSGSDDVSVLFNEDRVGVECLPSILPHSLDLSQNYPNPFNPFTQIKYTLPRDCHVKLTIYNILGQEVVTLVDRKQKAGHKTTRWDASSLSSGIYFYRLQAVDFVQTRKMVLLR